MNDKWLDDIQTKMAGFETEEPDRLWGDIAAGLEAAPAAPGPDRHILPPWLRRAAGIAAMLALAIATWMLIPFDSETTAPVADIPGLYLSRPTDGSAPVEPARIAEVMTPTSGATVIPTIKAEAPINVTESRPEPTIGEITTSDRSEPAEENESAPVEGRNLRQPVDDRYSPATGNVGYRTSARRQHRAESHSRFAIGVSSESGLRIDPSSNYKDLDRFYADVMTGSIDKNPDKPVLPPNMPGAQAPPGADTDMGLSPGPDSPIRPHSLPTPQPLGRSEAPQTAGISHSQPVRFAMSLSYRITPRLSAETGVTFTTLKSTYDRTGRVADGHQTLRYIGIPLGVRYDVAGWKRFSFYGSASVLAEKCVYGKTEMTILANPSGLAVKERYDSRVRPLQMSVSAAVGAQFAITPVIGIYAEPGLGYYFNNGSRTETIYADRPLNLNLNFGLRFTLGN